MSLVVREEFSLCFLQVERVLSDIVAKTIGSVGPDMYALTQLARDATERKRKTFLTPPEVRPVAYPVLSLVFHLEFSQGWAEPGTDEVWGGGTEVAMPYRGSGDPPPELLFELLACAIAY